MQSNEIIPSALYIIQMKVIFFLKCQVTTDAKVLGSQALDKPSK